jgi:transcriptional regulator with XRE-family HTH domain
MKKTIYEDEYRVFVKRLKKAREEAGLTQVQVAKKLGSSQAYISKVESAQLRVDVIELKRFAKIYSKNISYFLR